MKCLSIRQPHVHRIFCCGKDIENRSWATKYRGPLLIHAGQAFDNDAVLDEREQDLWEAGAMPRGCIVGVVDVIDCVTQSDSGWFSGPYGWVLANPRVFKAPIPYKGRLSLFGVPDDMVSEAIGGTP